MLRYTLVVIAFYVVCCAIAHGQTTTSQSTTTRPPIVPESTRERPAIPSAHVPEVDAAQVALKRGGGSLLRAAAVPIQPAPASNDPARAALRSYSPFAVAEPEPKIVRKHDLVTIIIREESETSNQGTSDLKRNSEMEAKIDQFIKLNLANLSFDQGVTGAAPTIKMSGTRNHKGEATVDRTDSFIARITAEVIDVKPNGTLVLQARKKIKNDDEEQTYVCAGICRVEDITPDNTVLSTQLYDLEVTKTTNGQVRSTTKKGLIGKLLDFVNLF